VASQTFVTRAGQQPALAVILVIAAVVGFGIGTWLGNATKPTPVVAAVASPSIPAVTLSPAATTSVQPTDTVAPTQAAPGQPEVIFMIEGEADDVTDSFEAKPGWQIQWQVDGPSIAIAVSGDPNLGVVIDQKGPASGVTGIAEGGEFSLDIVATGAWKVTVIDGEEPVAS
jgi:hypothetical protein